MKESVSDVFSNNFGSRYVFKEFQSLEYLFTVQITIYLCTVKTKSPVVFSSLV